VESGALVHASGASLHQRSGRALVKQPASAGCGSRLFLLDPEGVEIQLGSLDDPPFELRPQAELWIKRREPWIEPVEGAAQYRENRR
jgi:hypothetical protein